MNKDMSIKDKNGPCVVKLPDNTILSRADLPPKDTARWVVSRKLIVVRAVIYGLISLDEALDTYAISEEEFFTWVDLATILVLSIESGSRKLR